MIDLMQERYGKQVLDEVCRRYRDEQMTIRNKRGYYKFSEGLIPWTNKYSILKWLMCQFMMDPLVSYGKWHYGMNQHGFIFYPIKKLWFWIFNRIAGDQVLFRRKNGEYI